MIDFYYIKERSMESKVDKPPDTVYSVKLSRHFTLYWVFLSSGKKGRGLFGTEVGCHNSYKIPLGSNNSL